MRTAKSPRRILTEALRIAEASLPAYSHRFRPKTDTQHQWFACLALMDFYDLTYRATVELLRDCLSLGEVLALAKVPHFTTLPKAADRLLVTRFFRRWLTATVRQAQRCKVLRRRCRFAAIDRSGLES